MAVSWAPEFTTYRPDHATPVWESNEPRFPARSYEQRIANDPDDDSVHLNLDDSVLKAVGDTFGYNSHRRPSSLGQNKPSRPARANITGLGIVLGRSNNDPNYDVLAKADRSAGTLVVAEGHDTTRIGVMTATQGLIRAMTTRKNGQRDINQTTRLLRQARHQLPDAIDQAQSYLSHTRPKHGETEIATQVVQIADNKIAFDSSINQGRLYIYTPEGYCERLGSSDGTHDHEEVYTLRPGSNILIMLGTNGWSDSIGIHGKSTGEIIREVCGALADQEYGSMDERAECIANAIQRELAAHRIKSNETVLTSIISVDPWEDTRTTRARIADHTIYAPLTFAYWSISKIRAHRRRAQDTDTTHDQDWDDDLPSDEFWDSEPESAVPSGQELRETSPRSRRRLAALGNLAVIGLAAAGVTFASYQGIHSHDLRPRIAHQIEPSIRSVNTPPNKVIVPMTRNTPPRLR